MLDHIPNELLLHIFIRLPLESLVRFTSVCKSWHGVITNPEFIAMHYDYINNTRIDKSFFIRYYDMNESLEHYTIRNDNEDFSKQFDQIEFPYKIPYGELNVVGICCGLVCFYLEEFSSIVSVVLWNPSIRKWLPVPIEPHRFVLGFGVCNVTNDHKLVKLVYDGDLESSLKVPPLVTVYTLSTGSWRDVNVSTSAPLFFMDLENWSQVFVFGCVHWIAYHEDMETGGFRNLMVAFHISNEVFYDLILPDSLATERLTDLSITVLGDSLAVIKYTGMGIEEPCCVWVMEEYGVAESWTKLLTLRRQQRGITLGFRKDGHVVFPFRDMGLVSYNPETDKMKKLGITGDIMNSIFYIGIYRESLVLLTGGHSIIPRRFSKLLCSLPNRSDARKRCEKTKRRRTHMMQLEK